MMGVKHGLSMLLLAGMDQCRWTVLDAGQILRTTAHIVEGRLAWDAFSGLFQHRGIPEIPKTTNSRSKPRPAFGARRSAQQTWNALGCALRTCLGGGRSATGVIPECADSHRILVSSARLMLTWLHEV